MPLGIECGSRTKRDIWLLHDDLEEEIKSFKGKVILSFPEKVLHISSDVRKVAIDRIKEAISTTSLETKSVAIPEIPLTAVICPDVPGDESNFGIDGLKVTIATGAELWKITEAMVQEIETTLIRKISQSNTQNRQSDSILMIHISRVDEAFLRGLDVWKSDLYKLISKYPQLPFSALAVSLNDLTSEDLRMTYVLNPNLDRATTDVVVNFMDTVINNGSLLRY